jgi:putative Mn2+ efflux pump MntP
LSFGAILLLSLGLAMDATAVAASRGLAVSVIRARHVLLIAAYFGGFQALMPVAGWALGSSVGGLVAAWDHWIAFALLAAIGGKMMYEARAGDEVPRAEATDEELFAHRTLLVLAVATSIDALAAGITLPMLGAPLLLSVATIGVTTAAASALGMFAGRRFGALLGRRLDFAGGVALLALGFKILLEH